MQVDNSVQLLNDETWLKARTISRYANSRIWNVHGSRKIYKLRFQEEYTCYMHLMN